MALEPITLFMLKEGLGVGMMTFSMLKKGDHGASPIGDFSISVQGTTEDGETSTGTEISIQVGEDPRLKAIAVESEYKGLIAAFIKQCSSELALENSVFQLSKVISETFDSENDIYGKSFPTWQPETLVFSDTTTNEIGMLKGGSGHYYVKEDHIKVVTLFNGASGQDLGIGLESDGAALNEEEYANAIEAVPEMEYEISYTSRAPDVFPLNSKNPMGGSWVFIDKYPIPSEVYNFYGFYVDNTMSLGESTDPISSPVLLATAKAVFSGLLAGEITHVNQMTNPDFVTYNIHLLVPKKFSEEKKEYDGKVYNLGGVMGFGRNVLPVGTWVLIGGSEIKYVLPSTKSFHENVKEPGEGFSE